MNFKKVMSVGSVLIKVMVCKMFNAEKPFSTGVCLCLVLLLSSFMQPGCEVVGSKQITILHSSDTLGSIEYCG